MKESNGNSDADVELTYINFPFSVVFRPTKIIDLEFGPQIGFLISNTDRLRERRDVFPGDSASNNLLIDYGIFAGAGLRITPRLSCSFRYYRGFSNLSTNSSTNEIEKFNGVFQIAINFIVLQN